MADLSTLVGAIVERLTRPWRTYLGFYPFRVQSQTGDRLTLQSVGTGMDDEIQLDKAHGITGASEQNALGSIVLVGFQGGDRGAPFVAFFLPSVPVRVTLDATATIELGAGATLALALAPPLQTWGTAVTAYLGALDAAIVLIGNPSSGPPPVLSSTVAAVKVKGV